MKKTIRDIPNWSGKRALVREDFNVPFNPQGEITDDTRLREALPTLRYLSGQGARVVIMSHLGRPKGKRSAEFSMAPVAKHLQTLLPDLKVSFCDKPISDDVAAMTQTLQAGEILLLENIRFEPGEEKNDPELCRQLAQLGDIYVNDAFGTSHRAHASTAGVAEYVKPSVAGFLMEKEIKALSCVLSSTQPVTAIIGGSKISTKITVLENLLPKVSNLVIGGGMLFTFLKAQGLSVGNSLVEPDFIGTAASLLAKAAETGKTIVLASDVNIADKFDNAAQSREVPANAIPDGWMGLDIGSQSIQDIQTVLEKSPVVLWNGPLGVFEFENFAHGTRAVAETLADLTAKGQCQSILGGGDTVAAIEQFKIDLARYTHVSTGGGASLEFLEGKVLPGIKALE